MLGALHASAPGRRKVPLTPTEEGLDKMRIKANDPNWRGEREFGLDASKRKFSRDGKLGEARMG
ncbi:hypothetical protein N7455_005319 [Penicillium solitum]|uniref:uncharacterized protein n=1 Tax=Penicillium solitum TaxID=60172 RepID=UPI0032C42CC7|nr:hypothetical protein N7536_000910 [Penicillium majusculum]KAJ5870378.1 hypothetical protein N7455_005319 [Penicillium solitum]